MALRRAWPTFPDLVNKYVSTTTQEDVYGGYMMTSSNGNIFRVTGHLCEEFTGDRRIPLAKASDAKLWCSFYLRLNKRLSKQSRRQWYVKPLRSLCFTSSPLRIYQVYGEKV